MDYYVKGCRVISRINRSGQVMQCKIMHGVGRSGKLQEGEAGEFEGRDSAGADQALKRRTHQSDEAAQYLCGRDGFRPAGSSPSARERPEAETPS